MGFSRSSILAVVLPVGAAASYSEARALEYAQLSGAAYCSTQSLQDWSCGSKCSGVDVSDVKVCEGSTTRAFVGRWGGKCLLSFEGTSELDAWITNLKFDKDAPKWSECEDCRVHSGFLNEWYSLKSCVMTDLADIGCGVGSPLHVTGHSLGAALSGISMMSLYYEGWSIAEAYNFGMPRTGDEKFAHEFNALFGSIFFRVTHHRDPVPQVPPNQLVIDWHYEHVVPEVFYDGKVSDGHVECLTAANKTCAYQYWELAQDLAHIDDHLDYMGVQTGSSGCVDSQALTVVV